MYRWQRLREAFWFLPALMVVAALCLAQGMLALDRWAIEADEWVPTALVLGVDGSRGLLTAVAGSLLAVAGTTFSITISVIATASSSYGPRLVRNFMTDRRNQAVLGLFVSTFVYCLIVLRAVTSADDETGRETFVPYLAVYLAIVLALANVAALVYFLHHIAQSIQVASLVGRVRGELERVVDRLYGPGRDDDLVAAPSPPAEAAVLAEEGGFVVSVDELALVGRAREHDGRVEIVAIPGTHVVPGEPLARVAGSDPDALAVAVRELVTLGDQRTPYQDVHFAVQQLVEMAVRALSPGTNDPYTARNALDELGSALVVVAREPDPPTARVDDDGRVRLVVPVPSGVELVDAVFDDLRIYGAGDPGVVRAGLRLAGRMRRVAPAPVVERIDRQVDELLRACEGKLADFDLERLRVIVEDVGLPGVSAPGR